MDNLFIILKKKLFKKNKNVFIYSINILVYIVCDIDFFEYIVVIKNVYCYYYNIYLYINYIIFISLK